MIVVWLFLTMPWVCLQFVIVVFPDHTHLLFMIGNGKKKHFFIFAINGELKKILLLRFFFFFFFFFRGGGGYSNNVDDNGNISSL